MFGFLNKEPRDVGTISTKNFIGFFGKMPVHADFIKHNVASREVVALDGWVQEGVMLMNRKYGDTWKEKLATMPRYRFIWIGGEDDRSLTGLISPGLDKSGRCYPFVSFTSMGQDIYKNNHATVPLVQAKFYTVLDDISANDWQGSQFSELAAMLDMAGKSCGSVAKDNIKKLGTSLLENITMGEFWNEILPESDIGTRASFVRTLMSSLHTVARRTPQRVHWGIRLPLTNKPDQIVYVMFWIQLCESVLGDRPWRGQYFWNGQENGCPPQLMVYFRPVPPSYFSVLVEPRKNDGMVLDVAQEMVSDNSDKSGMLHIVDNDEVCLIDALELWQLREAVQ